MSAVLVRRRCIVIRAARSWRRVVLRCMLVRVSDLVIAIEASYLGRILPGADTCESVGFAGGHVTFC